MAEGRTENRDVGEGDGGKMKCGGGKRELESELQNCGLMTNEQ